MDIASSAISLAGTEIVVIGGMATEVSQILSNLTTIDLEKAQAKNITAVRQFLEEKKVKCTNHLISGAPTSQILSYLVNH